MATTRKRVRDGRLTWEVRWYDPDRRLRGKTFKRKVDAEQFRAQVEVDKRAGTYADPALSKTLLAEWAARWEVTQVHLRRSTQTRDRLLLERFILPRFGRRQLAAIGQLDVRQWVADLTAQGLAPSTVAKCYQVLGKVMAAAVDAGLIARSPCRAIKLPRVEREPPRFLTPAEVARLANAIDPRYRALVLVAAYGGLRIGELAGLTRRRVDLLRGTVEVAEIITEVEGRLGGGLPKTRAGRRTVGLPRRVVEELDQHLAAYTAPGAGGTRVHRTLGRPAAGDRVPRPGVAAGHHRRRPTRPQGPRAPPHRRGVVDRRRRLAQGGRRPSRAHLRLVHPRPLRRPVRGPRPGAARPPRRHVRRRPRGPGPRVRSGREWSKSGPRQQLSAALGKRATL
jgi:integrase